MKKIITLFVLFSMTIFLSCKKDDFMSKEVKSLKKFEETPYSSVNSLENSSEFELSTELLSVDLIQGIKEQVRNEDSSGIINDSDAIRIILDTIVKNGKLIHEEMLSKISETEEYLSLSQEAKDSVLNLSDNQFAELSLIYSFCREDDFEVSRVISAALIRSCLSGALGLTDLYYLIVVNPRALMSASGALSVLKHVGGRYLGWIGLGLAIWDFIDCIS